MPTQESKTAFVALAAIALIAFVVLSMLMQPRNELSTLHDGGKDGRSNVAENVDTRVKNTP